MQQQRTEVEAVFRNEILCQKCYGILQVFEWFCVRNTEEIKGQVIHIKKIWKCSYVIKKEIGYEDLNGS